MENTAIIENLNELKGGLENLTDTDLLENRMLLLSLVDEILENIKGENTNE